MANRWFRLRDTDTPLVGSGSVSRPDFEGYEDNIGAWSGNTAHPDGAPHWVVRVYADSSTLDGLASEAGVVDLGNVPVTALNEMFEQNRDEVGWQEAFRVE